MSERLTLTVCLGRLGERVPLSSAVISSQDYLSDIAAGFNSRAAKGDPVPIEEVIHGRRFAVSRAWLDGDRLMGEVTEVTKE